MMRRHAWVWGLPLCAIAALIAFGAGLGPQGLSPSGVAHAQADLGAGASTANEVEIEPSGGPAVPGEARSAVVAGVGGAPVLEQSVIVRTRGAGPAGAPADMMQYVFSDRGGTVTSAKLLDPRYTQDQLRTIEGVPAEKLAEGPLDVVTTWSPGYLPFRLIFQTLSTPIGVKRVVRRATGGTIASGLIVVPADRKGLAVDRAVRAQDVVTITAPASLAGRYPVKAVRYDGQLELEGLAADAGADGVAYDIVREGPVKEVFESETTFTRVTETPGLPLTYVWPDPATDDSPVWIEKRYEAGKHAYELRLTVTIHNFSEEAVKLQPGMRISAWQHPDTEEGGIFSHPTKLWASSCFADEHHREEHTSLSGTDTGVDVIPFDTRWIGVDTRYFLVAAAIEGTELARQCILQASPQPRGTLSATMLAPPSQTLKATRAPCVPEWMGVRYPERVCSKAVAALGGDATTPRSELRKTYQLERETRTGESLQQLEAAWGAIKGRQRDITQYVLYMGPKEETRLQATGNELNTSLDFGILAVISEPILAFMGWLHSLLGHWGLAIVVLTLSLKSLFLPLTHKSFMSMQKMQKLRPQLDELKERHKDDQQGMAKAQMALFKREGVNPLGGCLPMVIQMPIWFALYRVIYSSVELYHAPLGLWVHDLSAPDPFYVMPVVMGALMLVQSAFTPTSPGMDPVQAKMMKYGMPLMFSVMMVALPSGLVLYILVNTALAILQNLYIRRRLA